MATCGRPSEAGRRILDLANKARAENGWNRDPQARKTIELLCEAIEWIVMCDTPLYEHEEF